jgi:Ca2+-dependent lipid-binding protein
MWCLAWFSFDHKAIQLCMSAFLTADVQDIKMIIYNKNSLTEDTVIGSAVYPLAQAISTGFEESKVPVATPEGAIQGSLHIRAIFHSKYTH